MRALIILLLMICNNSALALNQSDSSQVLAYWENLFDDRNVLSLEREAVQLRQLSGMAYRDEDRLTVTAANGKAVSFVDRPDCDGPEASECIRHRLAMVLSSVNAVLIFRQHYENYSFALIDLKEAATFDFKDVPIFSPDNRHIAEISNDLSTDVFIKIYGFDQNVLTEEYSGHPYFDDMGSSEYKNPIWLNSRELSVQSEKLDRQNNTKSAISFTIKLDSNRSWILNSFRQ